MMQRLVRCVRSLQKHQYRSCAGKLQEAAFDDALVCRTSSVRLIWCMNLACHRNDDSVV